MTLTTRPLLRAVITLAGLVVILSGLTVTSSPATALIPARPEVGSCHALTWDEGLKRSDPDDPVSCNGTFTSRTYLVPNVPLGVDMRDPDQLQRVVDRKCDPAYEEAVSTSIRRRLMASYSAYWFAPTSAEIDAGARWVRCDLALAGGLRKLAPLPVEVRVPALGQPLHPDQEARCWGGKRQQYAVTVCARPHAYRAVGPFQMSGRSYPSDRQFARAASRRCSDFTRTGRWGYYTPSREAWRAGFKWVQCADVTPR